MCKPDLSVHFGGVFVELLVPTGDIVCVCGLRLCAAAVKSICGGKKICSVGQGAEEIHSRASSSQGKILCVILFFFFF